MSVRLNGSTSGYTELDAPAVAGNNTIRMPASNGAANQLVKNSGTAGQLTYSQATEDSAGNFAFNSGYGSVAPVYGCRAWVNFDGTRDATGVLSTANTNRLIRASGNVASVLRNAAGDYTITFVTAMPDANYLAEVTRSGDQGLGHPANALRTASQDTSRSSSSLRVYSGYTYYAGYALEDAQVVNVAIFR